MKPTALLFFVTLFIAGCYYDVEEELYPTKNCDTTNVTFKTEITNLITNNCIGCHGAFLQEGNVNLDGYANVKAWADSGRLLGSVAHRSGFSPMPKGASKLPDCQITQLEKWIADGAPNN